MNILIINGPNLNMLGIREPEIYGNASYADLCEYIENYCKTKNVDAEIFQSNSEGAIVDKIQEALGKFDGIVLNAGAYTHYSIAILDALLAVRIPTVEVHLSDVDTREKFRRVSVIREGCVNCISGKGF